MNCCEVSRGFRFILENDDVIGDFLVEIDSQLLLGAPYSTMEPS